MISLRGFILKPTERAKILLKIDTKDFQNSPPIERWTCFYETITGNFEANFLKNGNIFQKNRSTVF